MQVTISNEIYVQDPVPELVRWARENLVIPNPEYSKKQRMGLWTGNTEEVLYLYYVDGNVLALPAGPGNRYGSISCVRIRRSGRTWLTTGRFPFLGSFLCMIIRPLL